MIQLSYLGNHQAFDLNDRLNLLIVRRPPVKIPEHFIHVPQLSPSKELFNQAQVWKREVGEKEKWFHLYIEKFKVELNERDDLVRAMDKLEQRLKEGKKVRLFCYCKNHEFCHRGIIGNRLIEKGYEVDWCLKEETEQLQLF